MPLTKFKQGELRESKISIRKSFKVKQETL